MEDDEAIVSIISLKGQCHEVNNFLKALKVHKREKFFGSDFEFFTIL